MAKARNVIGIGFGLAALGYAVGILTAPRSGKQTRKQIKDKAASSLSDMERDLKTVYSQTKITLDKLAKDNPKLTAKLVNTKEAAQKSQVKLKKLISAVHGNDDVDEDLEAAIADAKKVLSELKTYVTK